MLPAIKAEMQPGAWQHSEVEDLYAPLIETLMGTPTFMRRFRSTFIAAGRLNFPDAPRPKEHYLQYYGLPGRQAWEGYWKILGMIIKLRRHYQFRMSDLEDRGVGRPISVRVPKSPHMLLKALARRYLKVATADAPSCYHLTEAQVRYLYYRLRLQATFGSRLDTIVEIGAGFGGLCGEIMAHLPVRRYYIVELPESVPLCYFYLNALFDAPVQVLYGRADRLDPQTRIAILPPWILPEIQESMDAAINTMSFQHMNAGNLDYYFRELDRLKTAKMYLVNRNEVRDPEDVAMDDYPIPASFRVVRQADHLFGKGVHVERFYVRGGPPT